MTTALIVVATILSVIIVLLTLSLFYLVCCWSVTIHDQSYTMMQLRKSIDGENPSLMGIGSFNYDNQESTIGQNITSSGDLIISRSIQQYLDVINLDDSINFGANSTLHSHEVDQAVDQSMVNEGMINEGMINEFDMGEFNAHRSQEYVADDNDSLHKTLLLQNLLPNASIKRVVDWYSNGTIYVGGIVVVIKPFKSLLPGDLLRVVSLHGVPESDPDEIDHDFANVTVDRHHDIYKHLIFSGIILNTYLDIANDDKVSLKFKERGDDLFRYAPLHYVTLETTLLASLSSC